jgi:hypothetical protein
VIACCLSAYLIEVCLVLLLHVSFSSFYGSSVCCRNGCPSSGLLALRGMVRPMINHIMDQPELVRGEGPIGIVVAPTRELVLQIVAETKRFGKPSVIKSRGSLALKSGALLLF